MARAPRDLYGKGGQRSLFRDSRSVFGPHGPKTLTGASESDAGEAVLALFKTNQEKSLTVSSRRLRRAARNWVVGLVGAGLLRLWFLTLRVRLVGFRLDGRVPLPPQSGIYVLWHQRLFMPAGFFRKSGFRVMISQHSDGEMVAKILNRLGMNPVRGSSTRGGAKAVRELLREDAQSGRFFIVITSDGPRGPARRFQAGAIYLASKTGLPLYANAITIKRSWRVPSWDGFLLPKPFTRAVIRTADHPVYVPPDLDKDGIEAYRLRMEETLESLTRETDERFEEIYAEARPARRLPPFETRPLASRAARS